MRIDGPQITGSFSIGNTTFPDVSTLATTGSNTFVGNQVISGSIVSTTTTLISGSSQVLSGTGIFSSSAQLPSGIISGSSQLPTGIVSSSAQVIAYGVSTTGSNILQGNQTITGSLFISENLVVAGSSSIQHISSSVVNINDNIITVNALNPSVRFGGLAVIDSGSSPQVSGSMLFDSINNQWLFVHQNQGTVTSSVLLMGPETYNNLGNESYITTNRLVKSTGIEHLSDSNITDTGTKVSINSSTEVTGSLITTGNVGIGTASPNANLDIQRVAGDSSDILRLGSNQNYYFGFSRNTSNGALEIQGNQTGYNNISLAPTSGNVGIGTSSPSANLHVIRANDGGSGTPGVILRTDNGANDIVRFQDGTTIVAVVKNDGSIGIGTPTPTNKLHLTGASSTPSLRLGSLSTGYHWDIGRENASTGDFVFNSTNASTGTTEKMRITQDSVAFLRMASGTGGIQFNGDTAAVNALDDYEEGSFTPSSVGTDFSSISVTFGRYIKIGNQVTINCRWSVTPGSTGMKYVVFDLPFAFVNNSNVSFTGAVSNYNEGQTAGSSNVGTTTRNSSGSTTQQYVQAYYTSTNVSTLLLSMTYFTFY
jgi:hypothetical protein